jgi:histidinol phosphatase-like PHP family hydrolase
LNVSVVRDVVVFEYADADEDDAEESELDIEVEMEGGRASVEVEVGGDEYDFVIEAASLEEVYDAIAVRTGLDVDVIREAAEIEFDDDEANQTAANTTA